MRLFRFLFGKAPTEQTPPPVPKPEPPIDLGRLSAPRVIRPTIPSPGDYRFIALDVETANNWTGSICQIGLAIVMADNSIRTFSTLIDPRCHFDEFNIQLHGIEPQHVRGSPVFRHMIRDLTPLLERQPVVQHSTFDQRAIAAACVGDAVPVPDLRWIDSVRIARRAWPELIDNGGHGLAMLKSHLSIDFNHHDAGEDARAAAIVVLRAEEATGQPFDVLASAKRTPATPQKVVTRHGADDQPLSGQSVVFTGSLSMTREQAADMAAARGLSVKSAVSTKTNLLVVGDQDLGLLAGHTKSSKHRKAEELVAQGHPIRIIGETEFQALVRRGDGS